MSPEQQQQMMMQEAYMRANPEANQQMQQWARTPTIKACSRSRTESLSNCGQAS
jgi:hypothetical protein